MKLTELLRPEHIRVPLAASDKSGVLHELVHLLRVGDPGRQERIFGAVLDREKIMSTGIGGGVAIPHGKCDAVEGVRASFGVTGAPIDFDSIDGQPVRICFMIVSEPHTTGPHIRVLAQISSLLNRPECKEALVNAASAEEVLEIFARWESD